MKSINQSRTIKQTPLYYKFLEKIHLNLPTEERVGTYSAVPNQQFDFCFTKKRILFCSDISFRAFIVFDIFLLMKSE